MKKTKNSLCESTREGTRPQERERAHEQPTAALAQSNCTAAAKSSPVDGERRGRNRMAALSAATGAHSQSQLKGSRGDWRSAGRPTDL